MVDHSAHTAIKPTAENERALKISGWLTGIYFLIELGIGIYTGSVTVTSDAFHLARKYFKERGTWIRAAANETARELRLDQEL